MPRIPLTEGGPDKGGNYEYHWSGPFLEIHFLSDVGKSRRHNEDSCILSAPEEKALADKRGILTAVADGMGGASAGEFASRLALQSISEQYFVAAADTTPLCLRKALEHANRRVFDEAEHNPRYQGMGTTVSALVLKGQWAYGAQVGDSRIYLARPKLDICQLTDDHSLVAEQVRNGFITEDEARNHSLKNLITRAVGIRDTVSVDLFAIRAEVGDTFLICSDGLSNMVTDDAIGQCLAMDNLQGSARVLVGRALEEGGSDNVTVALLRITDVPPKTDLENGATEIVPPGSGLLGKLKRRLLS